MSFERIAAAARLLRDGFSERQLLTPQTDDLLATLIELSEWLGGIARRELAGQVPTDAENARLFDIGSELEYLWIASEDIELDELGQAVPDWTERAGLVTDVFTNTNDHLQLGTGAIDEIHVIVPLGDGRFELAYGQVYSFYEFWRSNAESRMTDEEWKAIVSDGTTPPHPAWTDAFLTGGDVATDTIIQF